MPLLRDRARTPGRAAVRFFAATAFAFALATPMAASELSDRAAQTAAGQWTTVDVAWHCSNDYSRACTATNSYAQNTAAHQADCPGSDPRNGGHAYCVNVFYMFSGAHGMNTKSATGSQPESNHIVTSCPAQEGPAGLMVGSYAPHVWWNPVTRELISFESQHGTGQGSDDIYVYRESSSDFKTQFFQPNNDGNNPAGTYHDSQYRWRPTGDYECDPGDYGNMTHTYDQQALGFPAGSTKGRILFNNGGNYVEEWDLDAQSWNLNRSKPNVYPRITPMIWWWPEYQAYFFAQFLDTNGDKWCEVYRHNYSSNTWSEYRNSKTNPIWRCGEWHNFAVYDDFHGWVWMGGGDYSSNTPSQQYFHILKPDGTSVDNLRFPTSVGWVGTGENQAHVIVDPASGKLLLWNAGLEFWEYDHDNGRTWTKLCDGVDKINGQTCLPGYQLPPFLFSGSPQGAIEGAQFGTIPEYGVIVAWDYTGPNARDMMWVYRHTPGAVTSPPPSPGALRIP